MTTKRDEQAMLVRALRQSARTINEGGQSLPMPNTGTAHEYRAPPSPDAETEWCHGECTCGEAHQDMIDALRREREARERAEAERDALRHDIERLTETNAGLATNAEWLRSECDSMYRDLNRLIAAGIAAIDAAKASHD